MNDQSRHIQRVYLGLLLLHTLAASLIWGINTLFLLDAGLSNGQAIKSRGLLIVEHASEISFPDNIKQLRRWRTIDHGEKILSIYERI